MIQAFLYGAMLLTGYVLLVAVHPLHRCPRCKGERVIRARRQVRPCLKCNGRGRAYRLGAPLVHRLLSEHAGPWVRDRIRPSREDRGER